MLKEIVESIENENITEELSSTVKELSKLYHEGYSSLKSYKMKAREILGKADQHDRSVIVAKSYLDKLTTLIADLDNTSSDIEMQISKAGL